MFDVFLSKVRINILCNFFSISKYFKIILKIPLINLFFIYPITYKIVKSLENKEGKIVGGKKDINFIVLDKCYAIIVLQRMKAKEGVMKDLMEGDYDTSCFLANVPKLALCKEGGFNLFYHCPELCQEWISNTAITFYMPDIILEKEKKGKKKNANK